MREICLSLLGELRRRNIFRVAATYVVASWLILQVVATIDAPLNLPDWFDTVVVVLLAIGFPIAVLLGWAFELTPEGIRTTPPNTEVDNRSTSSKLDYALIGALFIVAGALVWGQIDSSRNADAPSPSANSPEKSIAVLPFVDMSPGGDQEYFGDGIAEELLNELTRLDGLRVVGRTSSFSFKGGEDDIREIGEALSVDLILEGSVRQDGDRVRVTAQLVNAINGYHHWSQTYNRDLNDIFAIQGEIAESIAGVLGVTLGVGNINSFPGAGTDSVEAYEAYLRARAISYSSNDRIRAFERAVQIDPNYAAALADLGLTIASTMWKNPPEEAPGILDRALPILHRATELRPDSAYAYSLLATANYGRMKWNQTEQYYDKALAIARDGGTLRHYGNMLMRSGRSEAAIGAYDEAAEADRYAATIGDLQLNAYLSLERYSEAGSLASQRPRSNSFDYLLALNLDDVEGIRAAIKAFPVEFPLVSEIGIPLLKIIDSPDEALDLLKSVYADTDNVWPSKYHDIALLAAYFGDPEFSLKVFSPEVRLTAIRFGALWYPVMSEVRQLPEFHELMEEIGLVEYWRTHGWSSHCQPLEDDEFRCF